MDLGHSLSQRHLISTNYIYKDPISKSDHIHRNPGDRTSTYHVRRHNSTRNGNPPLFPSHSEHKPLCWPPRPSYTIWSLSPLCPLSCYCPLHSVSASHTGLLTLPHLLQVFPSIFSWQWSLPQPPHLKLKSTPPSSLYPSSLLSLMPQYSLPAKTLHNGPVCTDNWLTLPITMKPPWMPGTMSSNKCSFNCWIKLIQKM